MAWKQQHDIYVANTREAIESIPITFCAFLAPLEFRDNEDSSREEKGSKSFVDGVYLPSTVLETCLYVLV